MVGLALFVFAEFLLQTRFPRTPRLDLLDLTFEEGYTAPYPFKWVVVKLQESFVRFSSSGMVVIMV